jgi:hypothetical protein
MGRRELSRSAAAALAAAALAALLAPHALAAGEPVLATPAQVDAEQTALRLLADPQVKAAEAKARAELAATPRGRTPDGAARIEEAVAQWTASVIFKVLAQHRAEPAILWATDDTPRSWLGHTLPGVGTSGDNPDNVYRIAYIDGAGRYEITGQIDPAHRPAQFSFQFDRGDGAQPQAKLSRYKAGMGAQLAMVTDRDLKIEPDGSFRLTIGPGAGEGANHVAVEPGLVTVGLRDSLSDWSQRPNALSIRRLDAATPKPVGYPELRERVVADLGEYVRFWSAFPDKWFGGIGPNAVGGPVPRDGGWGFVAGIHYKLQPGEALLVRTRDGQADYTGFQVTDTWMIAPDAKRYQTSLNKSQARRDADGGYTYVISPVDPGVANWLDTAGLQDGYAVLRWQALPPTTTKDDLVREVRLVKISDLADGLPGVERVSPADRKTQLVARADGYANRTR